MDRMLDLIIIIPSLVLLSPLMACIAILVRIEFGSPVLFSQLRPGLHGRPFILYKFRTMKDVRDDRGRLLPDRQRLTNLGRFLRATSLDELPEFFNVLKGDMRLVGPRPLLLEYLDRYTPEQMRRHEVKPGITGWAQVNGRNAISWEQKFDLDVWYVGHHSLWLDIKVLMMTLLKIIRREGISQPGHATMPVFWGTGTTCPHDRDFNILFTSVGRRVSLIRHFMRTLQDLGLRGKVVGVDSSDDAPAFHVVDKAYRVCPIADPLYIQTIRQICENERIKLLFPLIDTDLMKLAEGREEFAAAGTNAVICDPEFIALSIDKCQTHHFFASLGMDTPKLLDAEAALDGNPAFPLFIKPRYGNASKGIFTVRDRRELIFFKDYVPQPILQEYIEGMEVTIDMLFDFSGNLRCLVPRQRLEVRAGEVSKGIIIDQKEVVEEGWRVGRMLKGCRGCINIQCFLTRENRVRFVEINPRFGGGAPLSINAGADFPRWIIEMARGKDPGDIRNAYKKNVVMLRYDEAVFLEGLPSMRRFSPHPDREVRCALMRY